MSYAKISLIAVLGIVLLANPSLIYATADSDAQKTIAKQITLNDLLEDDSAKFTQDETKVIEDELVRLHEESTGLQVSKKQIHNKVGIINSLFSLYDELLQPSVISEIKHGEVEHAYSIVKSYNHVFNEMELDSDSLMNKGSIGTVENLNNLVPKQLSIYDLLK